MMKSNFRDKQVIVFSREEISRTPVKIMAAWGLGEGALGDILCEMEPERKRARSKS